MNPLSRCSKGYKKCIKNCHEHKKCPSCPYLKECCHSHCLTLPPGSHKAMDGETGSGKEDPLVKCVEFILGRHL